MSLKTYQNITSRFHIWFPQEKVVPDLVHAAQSCCPAELPWGLKWVLLRCCYLYLSSVPSLWLLLPPFSEGPGQKGQSLPRQWEELHCFPVVDEIELSCGSAVGCSGQWSDTQNLSVAAANTAL